MLAPDGPDIIVFGEHIETNEAPQAAAVAAHLGTNHTELNASEADALACVADLPATYDEPFADVSQIPTLLLSRLTRQHVTVGLTGDGGDEQMAGYRRYKNCLSHWRDVQRIPQSARSVVRPLTSALGAGSWQWAERYAQEGKTVPRWTHKLGKISQRSCNWAANSPQEILANKFNKCLAVDQFVTDAHNPSTPLTDPADRAGCPCGEA